MLHVLSHVMFVFLVLDVGRSCIIVSIGGKNVMLDCGMHMGYNDEVSHSLVPRPCEKSWVTVAHKWCVHSSSRES